MKKLLSSDQRGVGHLGAILAIVVVLALGGVGYYVFNKNKSGGSSGALDSAVVDAIKSAKCDYSDKDLCKFYTGFTVQKYYTVNATAKDSSGATSTSFLQWQDGKSYIKLSGDNAWEVITIGDVTYTKASDGTWWKQTNAKPDTSTTTSKPSFEDPKDNEESKPDATQYKLIGKEACGKLTCFKYQTIDPSAPNDISYFWFDDKDYQLRKTHDESGGTTTDSTYDYSKFDIKVPSPVKELGPNQYLVPGQSEPQTIPSDSDATGGLTPEQIQQLQEQYGQQ